MNYAWDISQSETEKYFERIIIAFIIDVSREKKDKQIGPCYFHDPSAWEKKTISYWRKWKTEKGKFIKVMPKPNTLPGWKQFLQLLFYFLKLPVRIKVLKKVIDIKGTRLLQIAIIVEEANAQYWNLPYYKAENLNLNIKRFSRGTRLNRAYVCFTRM